jgi:hypothetical protein
MRCGGVHPKSTALPEPDLFADRRYGAAQIAALMKLVRTAMFFLGPLGFFVPVLVSKLCQVR